MRGRFTLVQPHLAVVQGLSLWQEHCVTLRILSGAGYTLSGTVVGRRLLELSTKYPCLLRSRRIGCESIACLQTRICRWAPFTFSRKYSVVGGSDWSFDMIARRVLILKYRNFEIKKHKCFSCYTYLCSESLTQFF